MRLVRCLEVALTWKMTLLAIDDDPRSLALISATVEQEGLEVLTCDDPERAIEIVRKRLPRVVICDLVMPKLSGMQVLQIGRAHV